MPGFHVQTETYDGESSVGYKLRLLGNISISQTIKEVLDLITTETTMLTNSRIALSLALFVAMAPGAKAAPKHVHHQTATVRHVPGAAYQSFGLESYPVMLQKSFQVSPTEPTNGVAR